MTDGKELEVKWLRPPVSFWNEEDGNWAEMTYGDGWEDRYDVVRILKYLPKCKTQIARLAFEHPQDGRCVMEFSQAQKFFDQGLFQGIRNSIVLH